MASKNTKTCSTSLAIGMVQIRTRMRCYYIPIRMAKIRNTDNIKCWQGCGEIGSLLHWYWAYKIIQPLLNSAWHFVKTESTI